MPSLTKGTVGKERFGFITRLPRWSVNKFDMTRSKSDVVLTGRKRRRGTLIPGERKKLMISDFHFSTDEPWAPSKLWIAAPLAVSSWMMFVPRSKVLKRKSFWFRSRQRSFFYFLINDDFHLQRVLFENSFDGRQIDPKIVRVENSCRQKSFDENESERKVFSYRNLLTLLNSST